MDIVPCAVRVGSCDDSIPLSPAVGDEFPDLNDGTTTCSPRPGSSQHVFRSSGTCCPGGRRCVVSDARLDCRSRCGPHPTLPILAGPRADWRSAVAGTAGRLLRC